MSYLGTNLSSSHEQVLRLVLVSLYRVLLRSLLTNVPHCAIQLSYLKYPQMDRLKEYNQVRPPSALDYRPPVLECIIPLTLA